MAVTEAAFRASILPFTLHYEGGLSVRRTDPGNWTGGKVGVGKLNGTKYGIAASSHPTLDIRHLTLASASSIYWTEYFLRPGFDRLSLPLALVVFDTGVNCGPSRAQAWLSLAAKYKTEAEQIAAVTAFSLAYHKTLKTWPEYGPGWQARINACAMRARTLLAAAPAAVPTRLPQPYADTPKAAPRPADTPAADPITLFLRGLFAALTGSGAQPHGA